MTGRTRLQPLQNAAMRACAAIALAMPICAGGAAAQERAGDYAAIVAAPDRSDADRQTDARRDPLKLLAFSGVRPGMKVLDMGAGGGYSSELMARAVGTSGVVYAQTPPISARARRSDSRRA